MKKANVMKGVWLHARKGIKEEERLKRLDGVGVQIFKCLSSKNGERMCHEENEGIIRYDARIGRLWLKVTPVGRLIGDHKMGIRAGDVFHIDCEGDCGL